jgi:hypothetical protein
MRRSMLLLVAFLLGLAVAPFPESPASASCAAPYLPGERLVLQRGTTVTVEGRAFVDGCQDTMSCSVGLGCEQCEYDDPPPVPMDDVRLRLGQNGRRWELAVADASAEQGRLGEVEWSIELPDGVRPGPARLLAERAQPVRVRIR